MNGQLGAAVEATFGVPVTPDNFFEFLSEGLERRINTLQSEGIRPGTRGLRRASARVVSTRDGGGPFTVEVATTGMSLLFEHMLGDAVAPVQLNAGPAYLHEFQLGELDGKSLTIQKGVKLAESNTFEPFTFTGCKFPSWELSINAQQILQLAITVDAADVRTDVALAAAAYPNRSLFSFLGGRIRLDDGAVAGLVSGATVRGENPMKTDRYGLGSNGVKREQLTNGFPTTTGTLNAEFFDLETFYERYELDTGAALELEFVGAVIDDTPVDPEDHIYERLTVIVPEIHFTGDTPKVGGTDLTVQNVPFEGLYDGVNVGTTIEYVTTDTGA